MSSQFGSYLYNMQSICGQFHTLEHYIRTHFFDHISQIPMKKKEQIIPLIFVLSFEVVVLLPKN